jgi:hypothetical protein
VNYVAGDFRGLQLALVGNIVGKARASLYQGDCDCIQVGLGNVVSGRVRGIQVGFANVVWSDGYALQIGMMNIAHEVGGGSFPVTYGTGYGTYITTYSYAPPKFNPDEGKTLRGVQIGLDNSARRFDGVQAGILFNRVRTARGLQLGLVNVAGALSGIQIGLFNMVRGQLRGVQIGGINLALGSQIPFLLGINVGW